MDAHVDWRGLLLIKDCGVFADTSEKADEVKSTFPFYI